MNVVLEVTPGQAEMIERALRAYGGNKSAMVRDDIVILLDAIETAKTNRAA
jgi:hypothetical protein